MPLPSTLLTVIGVVLFIIGLSVLYASAISIYQAEKQVRQQTQSQ